MAHLDALEGGEDLRRTAGGKRNQSNNTTTNGTICPWRSCVEGIGDSLFLFVQRRIEPIKNVASFFTIFVNGSAYCGF